MQRPSGPSPRIVHLISSLGVGGAERLLVDFVRALDVAQARNVTVVVMNEADPALLEKLREGPAQVVAWNRPRGSRDPRYLGRLLKLTSDTRPTIIHAHNRGSKMWAMLAKLAQPRLRVVFTVHAMNVASGYGARHRMLHNALVDRTVAISRAVTRECEESGLRNVVLIPNGVDLSRFRTAEEPLACRLEREPDRVPLLVTVARLVHDIKGQDVLIEAAALLRARGTPVRIRLVGSPSRDQPETPALLASLVERHGLADSVEIAEGVSDAAEHIRDADICVVPSRQEGFGLVILEAMAAGVPVVASRLDGPAELISDGINGYLAHAGDPGDLADKIARMLEDRPAASRFVQEGRSTAAAHDIEVMRDAYLTLYRTLTA